MTNVSLEGMTNKQLRELIIAARGEFIEKCLGCWGDTCVYGHGYENNPSPSYFRLEYEGIVIHKDGDIDCLLITDNYDWAVINEDEIDTLSQMTELLLSRW